MPGHSHGGGGCSHEHDHDDHLELGVQYSLYSKIDTDRLTCLNETVDGAGKTVFKPWDLRLDRDKLVESDADAELLFNITFSGHVKLKGMRIIGGDGDAHPDKINLYKDKPDMAFDDCSVSADQSFALTRDSDASIEYPIKVVKFSSINHLALHFPSNFGGTDDPTVIYYIGLRGEFVGSSRQEAVICTYEARAMPQDHKGEVKSGSHHSVF